MIKNVINQNLRYSQYPSDFNSPNLNLRNKEKPVCISVNGIRYKGTEENGRLIINNINVKPGIERVVFDLDGYGHKNIYFRLSGNYCFNWVREIHIGKNVKEVCIKNSMFPNVNLVTSENIYFEDGRDVLVHNETLLNSFYKTSEYTLDMKDIVAIADLALHRCKTKNAINTDSLTTFADRAFFGYDCFTDPKTKTKMFGDVLVGVDMNAEVIELPDDRYELRALNRLSCSRNNKTIKIHKYQTLKTISTAKLPGRLIMDIKGDDEDDFWAFPSMLKDICDDYLYNIEIYGSKHFRTYDGILYSADMTNLLLCPRHKTGTVNVPHGVENISNYAFYCSKIEEIQLPSSLKTIGSDAFNGCGRLHTVSLNQGLEFIGKNAFYRCRQLKDIEIPSSVRTVPESCFENSPLENITLHEGLIEIQNAAFKSARGELHLPKTLSITGDDNFMGIKSIFLKGKTLPFGLLASIAKESDCIDFLTVTIHCNDTLLCIPKMFFATSVQGMLTTMERLPVNDIKKNSHAFLYYMWPQIKQDKIALEMYEVTRNEKIKDFLKKRALPYGKSLIEEHDEVELIKLLNTGAVEYSDMKEILSMLEDKNMVTATAYILNTIGKRETVDNIEDFKL